MQPGPQDTLWIDRPVGVCKDAYVEVKPYVLQNTSTGDLAVFGRDEIGQVRSLAIGSSLINLVKAQWYGGRVIKFGVMGFTLLIFLATLIAAPVTYFVRRRKRDTDLRSAWFERLARWVALALCAVGFVFLVSMLLTDLTQLDTTMALAVLPWYIAVLAPVVLLLAVVAWWKRWWSLADRLGYTVLALAGMALLWFEIYWELLVS